MNLVLRYFTHLSFFSVMDDNFFPCLMSTDLKAFLHSYC